MAKTARNKLALNVSNLRKAKKMKKEELSLALGLDNSYISKLEKSKINITIDKIEEIAEYFDVNFIELFK